MDDSIFPVDNSALYYNPCRHQLFHEPDDDQRRIDIFSGFSHRNIRLFNCTDRIQYMANHTIVPSGVLLPRHAMQRVLVGGSYIFSRHAQVFLAYRLPLSRVDDTGFPVRLPIAQFCQLETVDPR